MSVRNALCCMGIFLVEIFFVGVLERPVRIFLLKIFSVFLPPFFFQFFFFPFFFFFHFFLMYNFFLYYQTHVKKKVLGRTPIPKKVLFFPKKLFFFCKKIYFSKKIILVVKNRVLGKKAPRTPTASSQNKQKTFSKPNS